MFELNNLEELPEVEEGAMPSLKIFTVILCEGLKMFPQNYLNFEKLQKVRVYGCWMVLKNLEREEKTKRRIEIVTMSTQETIEFIKQYLQVRDNILGWFYNDFSRNELFLFLSDLYRHL